MNLGSTQRFLIPATIQAANYGSPWPDNSVISAYLVFDGGVTCTYGATVPSALSADVPFMGCSNGATAGMTVASSTLQLSGSLPGWYANLTANLGRSIDDNNPCTIDRCVNGGEQHPYASEGTNCDTDSSLCNGAGTCNPWGSCLVGPAPDPNDGNDCTNDSCDPSKGILNVPNGTCPPPVSVPASSGTTVPTNVATTAAQIFAGAVSTDLDAKRAAIIRGRIVTRSDGLKLPGVTVSVLNHPEFGTTTTRTADGYYDIAVNGGDTYTLEFSLTGYVPVQRKAATRWLDFTAMPDAAMVAFGTAQTMTRDAPTAWQVFRGDSTTTDAPYGTRRPRLFIPPLTHPSLPASGNFDVRATEFTVGALGAAAMPGDLPPQSAYTYALDLSIVGQTGTTPITFNNPMYLYVEDFTGAPVSNDAPAPTGSYDRVAGTWKADASGTIISFSVTGSVATLTGGIAPGTDELAMLGQEYGPNAPNQLFWRVPISHFTSYDTNWNSGLDPNAAPPPMAGPQADTPSPRTTCNQGSIIECENQVLGESVPVVGTPFSLHYRSETQNGYHPTITVPVAGNQADVTSLNAQPTFDRAEVEIVVAGQRHVFPYPKPLLPNQMMQWSWDRTDAYNNIVQGTAQAHVTVAYVYKPTATNYTTKFGNFGAGVAFTGTNRANREIRLEKKYDLAVGGFDVKPLGLGGWTLSANHVMEPNTGTVWFGNGTKRVVADQPALLTTLVSDTLSGPKDVAVGPDGNIYVRIFGGAIVKRSGSAFVPWSGSGSRVVSTTGTPIANIALSAHSVTVAPDGQIYITEDCRILRVDPVSTLTFLVAGVLSGGVCPSLPSNPPLLPAPPLPFSPDGTRATDAFLDYLSQSAVTPDGSVYFGEGNLGASSGRLRRVRPDGTLETVAGTGTAGTIPQACETNSTCFARLQNLGFVEQIAYDSMGRLYFYVGGTHVVWRLDPDGILHAVAGASGNIVFAGDGGPAQSAGLDLVKGLSVRGGSLYISEFNHVRRVSPDGLITTVLGHGNDLFPVNGPLPVNNVPATAIGIEPIHAVPGPDGYFYVIDYAAGLFRFGVARDPSTTNTFVRSDDGSEVYEFDPTGRHLKTRSAYHGATLYEFGQWDASGRATTITDGSNNVTTIAYGSTEATITSPFGKKTTIKLTNGYATEIDNPSPPPANPPIPTTFFTTTHSATGLLTSFADENHKVHTFAYTGAGLLQTDTNPLAISAGTRLSRSVGKSSFTVGVATPENRVTTHRVDFASTVSDALRTEERTHTDPMNLVRTDDHYSDGTRKLTYPHVGNEENSVTDTTKTDPRFGFGAAYTTSSVVRAGASKSYTATRDRQTTMTVATDPFTVQTETEIDTTTDGSSTMSSTEKFDLATSTVTTTSSLGRQTKRTLDLSDRVTKIEIPGNVPGLAQPLQALNITYDASGRLSGTSFGASQVRPVTVTYSPTDGWVTGVNTPLGNVVYDLHDAAGRPRKVTLPGTPVRNVLLAYDAAGNVTNVTTPMGYLHTMTPNAVDLLATYAPPSASGPTGNTSYGYDNDSLLISLNKPGGSTVSYDRDSAGRSGTVTYPTGTGYIDTLAYTYELDHVKTITSALGSALTYTYDGDMVTQEQISFPSLSFDHTVRKTYDNFQRVTERDIDQQAAINFEYDADGLVSRMTGIGWGPYTITRTAGSPSLPANGMISGTTLGSNLTDTYEYDTFGALTKYQVKFGAILQYEVDYTRNPATGRVDSMDEYIQDPSAGWCKTAYVYDDPQPGVGTKFLLSSVVSASTKGTGTCTSGNTANTYDLDGNTPYPGGTFDAQDRLTYDGYWTYGFDADGNVASQTSPGNDTYPFVTDAMGNLRRMTASNLYVTTNYDFLIDGRNRRFGDQVAYNWGTPTLLQGYVWDGGQIVGFHTPSGVANNGLKAHWAYGTKSHVPDLMVQWDGASWKAFRVISDQLGSVKMVINASTGAVVEWRRYDAWGVPAAGSASAFSTVPFGFAGGLWNGNTGLYRFGARDYNPWKGRWWSKDSSRFAGGWNLYAYCENDPINCIDPNGLGWSDFWACMMRPFSTFAMCVAEEVAGFPPGGDGISSGGIGPTTGGNLPGPGGGKRSNGNESFSCDGKGARSCQYYCPQAQRRITKIFPWPYNDWPCPDTWLEQSR